jgi:hypothetical protein
MKKLPDKLSDLIEVAVKDLEAVEQDPHYVVNMDTWHRAEAQEFRIGQQVFEKEPCTVCLAGAVMAKTLEVPRYWSKNPVDFRGENSTEDKLIALDLVRRGFIDGALRQLGHVIDDAPYEFVPDYRNNSDEFKIRLRIIAQRLKGMGL